MSQPNPTIPVFVALKPDPSLSALVQRFKDRTRELAGDQLYLADPPHLTVYLAVFPHDFRATDKLDAVMRRRAPQVRLIGWHSWIGDALTGRNTLVCNIHPEDKIELRKFQADVVATLAPYRDIAATNARLASRLEALSPTQRDNLERFGFPYLGDGWEPHVSVASIDPIHWPTVWGEFAPKRPLGTFALPTLEEFELHGVEPMSRGWLGFD